MTDYKTAGIHQINGWLWSQLKDFEYKTGEKAFAAYSSGDLANTNAFVPSQQQAEFNDIAGGAPFIVYNFVISPTGHWWEKREVGAYVIYDDNIARLRAIQNYMVDLLCREDISAREVNSWLAVHDAGLPNGSPWDFKYIHLTGADGPDRFGQEGGRQGASISISYEFTRDLNEFGMRL